MEPKDRTRFAIIAGLIGFVLLTTVITVTVYLPGRTSSTTTTSPTANRPEESLEIARDGLSRATHQSACREAINKVSEYLNRSSGNRPQALTAAQRDFLEKELQLHKDQDALMEVSKENFTALDVHHLDLCFLARDVIRSQQEEGAKALSPAEQAAVVFQWTVRQVHLPGRPVNDDRVPPQFILRRGWGTPLERALVFLALVSQMRLPSCLVVVPEGDSVRLWACGVLVEQEGKPQILLFDPRMGLPVPGPGGKGIATLAEAQTKPEVLKQLTVDKDYPYDVNSEQAAKAEIHLVCFLSALAPRMSYLEARLQDPAIRAPVISVNLSVDPQALQRQFQAAVGTETKVKLAVGLTGILRQFLSAAEGGVGDPKRVQVFNTELIPFGRLPERLQRLEGEPGLLLHGYFADIFLNTLMSPGKQRDLILRGQLSEATEALVSTQISLARLETNLKEKRWPEDHERQLENWLAKLNEANAEVQKAKRPLGKDEESSKALKVAQIKELEVWKEGWGPMVEPLVQGTAIEPRREQLYLLLALCMHEKATQRQARFDQKNPGKNEAKKLQGDWNEAVRSWEDFTRGQPGARAAHSARRFHAEALDSRARFHAEASLRLQDREGAIRLLEDLSGNLTNLEKTAHLYLAKELRKKKE